MVKDAEEHAEEDRQFDELVQARNQADMMIHATEKTLKEAGDKVTDEEKTKIEAAIKDLQDVLKDGDKAAIEEKTKALTESSHQFHLTHFLLSHYCQSSQRILVVVIAQPTFSFVL